MSHIEITVKATGEILEFNASTIDEVLKNWLIVTSYLEAYTKVKDCLKKVIPEFVDAKGTVEHNGYVMRVTSIQRMNYDKSILRQVIDEDTLDLLLEVSKTKVDNYIKENLSELAEDSTLLRKTMIPVGKRYQTVRVEKI